MVKISNLVVDDERRFVDGRDAVYFETSAGAIQYLETNLDFEIESLYLDYSLRGGSVQPVLDWLCNNECKVGTVYPCSSSYSGRSLIREILQKQYTIAKQDSSPVQLGLSTTH